MKRKKKKTPITRKAKAKPLTEERVREIVRQETNRGCTISDMEVIIKNRLTGKVISDGGYVSNLTISGSSFCGNRTIELEALLNYIDM